MDSNDFFSYLQVSNILNRTNMCKKKKTEVTLFNILELLKKALTNSEKLECVKAFLLNRTCLICAKKLHGRSDKIYCGIQCKNKYHSIVRTSTKGIKAEMMKTLMKNYHILEGFLGDEAQEAEVSQTQLTREGFQFDHITNHRKEGKKTRYRIFNREYEFVNTTKIKIFRNSEESVVSPLLFIRWQKKFPLIPTIYKMPDVFG